MSRKKGILLLVAGLFLAGGIIFPAEIVNLRITQDGSSIRMNERVNFSVSFNIYGKWDICQLSEWLLRSGRGSCTFVYEIKVYESKWGRDRLVGSTGIRKTWSPNSRVNVNGSNYRSYLGNVTIYGSKLGKGRHTLYLAVKNYVKCTWCLRGTTLTKRSRNFYVTVF